MPNSDSGFWKGLGVCNPSDPNSPLLPVCSQERRARDLHDRIRTSQMCHRETQRQEIERHLGSLNSSAPTITVKLTPKHVSFVMGSELRANNERQQAVMDNGSLRKSCVRLSRLPFTRANQTSFTTFLP
jgi:hypothetical protein